MSNNRLRAKIIFSDFFSTNFERPFAYEFLILRKSRLVCDSRRLIQSVYLLKGENIDYPSLDADYDKSALFFVGNNVI